MEHFLFVATSSLAKIGLMLGFINSRLVLFRVSANQEKKAQRNRDWALLFFWVFLGNAYVASRMADSMAVSLFIYGGP